MTYPLAIYGTATLTPAIEADQRIGLPRIDFLEFEFKASQPLVKYLPEDLPNEDGVRLFMDWNESSYDYNSKTGKIEFKAKGLMLNMTICNDAKLFQDAKLVGAQCFIPGSKLPDTKLSVHFDELIFCDTVNCNSYEFTKSQINLCYVNIEKEPE